MRVEANFPERGSACGRMPMLARVPHAASNTPRTPPVTANRMLSVRSCRTTRPRLAPRAARIANSRVRPVERASRRLAMLTHAISRTKPTAPSKTQRRGATSPTMSCLSGTRRFRCPYRRQDMLSPGLGDAVHIGTCFASVTPGFSRATASMPMLMRRSRNVGSVHCPTGT